MRHSTIDRNPRLPREAQVRRTSRGRGNGIESLRHGGQRFRSFRPRLEQLEDRRLLAIGAYPSLIDTGDLPEPAFHESAAGPAAETAESLPGAAASEMLSVRDLASLRPYVPDQLVVALRTDSPAAGSPGSGYAGGALWSSPAGAAEVVASRSVFCSADEGQVLTVLELTFEDPIDVLAVMESVEASASDVLWAAPNFIYEGPDPREYVPDDPQQPGQYHHDPSIMDNEGAWGVAGPGSQTPFFGDPGVVVAVTDDGVDLDHEDLYLNIWFNEGEIPPGTSVIDADLNGIITFHDLNDAANAGLGLDSNTDGRVVPDEVLAAWSNGSDDDDGGTGNGFVDDLVGWDFNASPADNDPNPAAGDSHGTHVAGIVAATADNATGVAGTAGGVTVMPLRWYGTNSWTSTIILDTFTYAVDNGADVVTTSYNMDGWVGDPSVIAGYDYMHDHGVLHFNSAGNNGQMNPPRQAFEQTLLVASTDSSDTKSSFSNYGTGIDIAAPGSSILSTLPGNAYGSMSGTSMAAPNAAAAAALILSHNPAWSHFQVAAQLAATADDIDGPSTPNPGLEGLLGGGRVDTYRGVTETLPGPQVISVAGLPADGGSTTSPVTGATLDFDQILDPAGVTAAASCDLREAGADGTFDTTDDVVYALNAPADYKVGTNEIEVDFAGGVSDIGSYRFQVLGTGGIQNPFGTPLDGDGDGTPGDPFQSFFDITPPPMEPVDPLGSLVYDRSLSGTIGAAGEVDTYTEDVDPGQTLTVVGDPGGGLDLALVLKRPDGTVADSADLNGPDLDELILTHGPTVSGTYTVEVSGSNSTTGGYELRVVLNAAAEREAHDGPANEDPVSAQDLDPSFIAIGGGAASRGAVLGVTDGADPSEYSTEVLVDSPLVYYQFEESAGSTTASDSSPNAHDGTYSGGVQLGEPGAVGSSARFDGADDFVDVPALDQYPAVTIELWAKLEGLGGDYTALYAGDNWAEGTVHLHYLSDGRLQQGFNGASPMNFTSADSVDDQWHHLVVTLNNTDKTRELYVDGRLTDQDTFTGGLTNPNLLTASIASWYNGAQQRFFEGLIDEVAIYGTELSAERARDHYQAALTEDWYSFSLDAGQSASLALVGLTSPNVQVELRDGSGALLAAGSTAENVDGALNGFVAPQTDTYYARVTGAATDYNLVVTREAAFDAEPNDDQDGDPTNDGQVAQDITVSGGALGHLGTAGGLGRLFAYDATANEIREVDPTTGAVLGSFPSPVGEASGPDLGLATTSNSLLVGGTSSSEIYELDPDDGSTIRTITNPGVNVSGIAFLGNEIYLLTDSVSGQITVLDYAAGTVNRTITASPYTVSEGLGASSTALLGTNGSVLYEIDPLTGATTSLGTLPGLGNSEGVGVIGEELFIADYSEVEVYDLATLASSRTLTGLTDLEAIGADGGGGGGGGADFYRVSVQAGDALTVQTFTPADGVNQFVNDLDPGVELFDPTGASVASGTNPGNELVQHTALLTGYYTVRVSAENDSNGEYVLRVDGATGDLPLFEVSDTDIAPGARFAVPPASITLDFNDLLLLSELQAADVTVDGTPVTTMTLIDGDTVTFDLPGGLSEGSHTIAIAAGAIQDVQATPIEPFSLDFYVDTTAPRVISSSIQDGATVAVGTLSYTAEFSEELDAAVLAAGDLSLVGTHSGAHAPSVFSYDPATSLLTVEFADLPDDSYTLTLLSGTGRFEDLVGNDLDGAPSFPLPSGDGNPGGDFVVSFIADGDTVPYPVPLAPKPPLGSLIYDPSVDAAIAPGGDTDRFTVDVDAGQTITVLADPHGALQPVIRLQDPGGAWGTPETAGGPGRDAVLQTVPADTDGTYTVEVSGWSGSTGVYTVQVTLNAALEEESHDGPANNDRAGAQDLSGSFIDLDSGSAQRGAVGGSLQADPVADFPFAQDGDVGNPNLAGSYAYNTTTGVHTVVGGGTDIWGTSDQFHYAYQTVSGDFEMTARVLSFADPLGTGHINGWAKGGVMARETLTGGSTHATMLMAYNNGASFQRRVTTDGTSASNTPSPVETVPYWVKLVRSGNEFTGYQSEDGTPGSWVALNTVTITMPEDIYLGLAVTAHESDYYLCEVQFDNVSLITGAATADWYRFDLDAGQSATLAAAGDVALELWDGSGATPLAVGVEGATNADALISDFVAPNAGTYYAQVAGPSGDYHLVVTRGADFDAEPNNDLTTAQALEGGTTALGYLSGPPPAGSPALGDGAAASAGGSEGNGDAHSGDAKPKPDDAEYVPGQLIVRFAEGLDSAARQQVVSALGGRVIRDLPLIDAATIELHDAEADVLEQAAAWSADPSILYAEPDYVQHVAETFPTDPDFDELWAMHNTGQSGGTEDADIDAPEAWDIFAGSSDVVVAVIDTGVDYNHVELDENMWVNAAERDGTP